MTRIGNKNSYTTSTVTTPTTPAVSTESSTTTPTTTIPKSGGTFTPKAPDTPNASVETPKPTSSSEVSTPTPTTPPDIMMTSGVEFQQNRGVGYAAGGRGMMNDRISTPSPSASTTADAPPTADAITLDNYAETEATKIRNEIRKLCAQAAGRLETKYKNAGNADTQFTETVTYNKYGYNYTFEVYLVRPQFDNDGKFKHDGVWYPQPNVNEIKNKIKGNSEFNAFVNKLYASSYETAGLNLTPVPSTTYDTTITPIADSQATSGFNELPYQQAPGLWDDGYVTTSVPAGSNGNSSYYDLYGNTSHSTPKTPEKPSTGDAPRGMMNDRISTPSPSASTTADAPPTADAITLDNYAETEATKIRNEIRKLCAQAAGRLETKYKNAGNADTQFTETVTYNKYGYNYTFEVYLVRPQFDNDGKFKHDGVWYPQPNVNEIKNKIKGNSEFNAFVNKLYASSYETAGLNLTPVPSTTYDTTITPIATLDDWRVARGYTTS